MENAIVGLSRPITKDDATNQMVANQKARAQRGEALADLLIEETVKQASSMKHFIASVVALDADGRAGFVVKLQGIQKERAAYAKENGSKLYKGITASAGVRLSEFITLAKALSKGYEPNMVEGYHVIVVAAREFMRALGEGDKRGRKATHGLVKAMKYLEKLDAIDDNDKAAIAALMNAAQELAVSMGLAADKGEDAPM